MESRPTTPIANLNWYCDVGFNRKSYNKSRGVPRPLQPLVPRVLRPIVLRTLQP